MTANGIHFDRRRSRRFAELLAAASFDPEVLSDDDCVAVADAALAIEDAEPPEEQIIDCMFSLDIFSEAIDHPVTDRVRQIAEILRQSQRKECY